MRLSGFTRAGLLWMLMVACGFPVYAVEPVQIRASILSNGNDFGGNDESPVVGERVTLAVDVMTSSWFTQAPRFPHLTIRDAVNLKASAFATNFSERIEGETYAVQRREYTIFPQRAGQFVIDGIEVVVWAADADASSAVRRRKHRLRSEPLLLQVEPLPEVEQSQTVATSNASLVAQTVDLHERFSADLSGLQVGDVVERHIEVKAEGTLGMLIPPLHWPAIDEARQRSLAPWVDDQTNRGEFVGLRREVRQYTLLTDGDIELPAITLQWWDGDEWQSSRVESRRVSVAAREGFDHYRQQLDSMNDRLRETIPWENWLSLALVAVPLLVGLAVFLWRLVVFSRERWRRYQCSEKRYWRRLLWASYFSGADTIQRCFYQWCQYSRQPAITVPVRWDSVWSQCFLLAQSGGSLSACMRREIRAMCYQVRALSRPVRQERGHSLSATVSLQPLNPQD